MRLLRFDAVAYAEGHTAAVTSLVFEALHSAIKGGLVRSVDATRLVLCEWQTLSETAARGALHALLHSEKSVALRTVVFAEGLRCDA